MSADDLDQGEVLRVAAEPRRSSWRDVLAFAAFAAIVLQVLGGVALSFHYVPTADLAHASLVALEQDHKYGVSLRALHWLGASAVIALLLANLLFSFLAADHKRPGRAAWISGVVILFVAIGFGITGELLPWTEQGVYATEVRTGLVGKAPDGEVVRQLALGGEVVAEPTLTRFHALHTIVLPALLALALIWHVRVRRRIGWPRFVTWPQALAAVLVTAGLAFGARELRAPLGAVFVPGDAGFEARPEWYFLWLNELLKLFPPELEAVPAFWIPNGLALLLLALPFLDRTRSRRLSERPLAVLGASLLVLALVVLSFMNRAAPEIDTASGEPVAAPPPLPYDLELAPLERRGYALVRQQNCLECHAWTREIEVPGGGTREITYGETQHDAPDLDELAIEEVDEIARIVQDPSRIGSLDMPAFDHVPWEDLRAIALYLKRIARD